MLDKVHLLVCENVEAEARAVLARGDSEFQGVTLASFPGRCGRPPLSIEESRRLAHDGDVATEIIGCACLTGLDTQSAGLYQCHANRVAWCFELFADRHLVKRLLHESAYLLSSGWLKRFRERLASVGFDRGSLRGVLPERVARLHLLDTGIDNESQRHLQELAEYAALPFETTWVGLDFFALVIKNVILSRRLALLEMYSGEAMVGVSKQIADDAMAMDLLGQLSSVRDEREAIRQIMELFSALFAPQSLSYVSFEHGQPALVHVPGSPPQPVDNQTYQRVAGFDGRYVGNETNDGFLALIEHAGDVFGVVSVDQIAFPEYLSHYLNLTQVISPICGLSISNARSYRGVIQIGEALQKANSELARLATIDGLTMLANRRHFDQQLRAEWLRSLRQQEPLSLIMVDIDHFKQFNDLRGHQAGDACLKDVAQIIAGCISRTGDLVARYGGEEFAVILPHTPYPGAQYMAEKIRESILRSHIEHGSSPVAPHITLSLGYATVVPNAKDGAAQLISMADQALYVAKHNGCNRSIGYDGKMSHVQTFAAVAPPPAPPAHGYRRSKET